MPVRAQYGRRVTAPSLAPRDDVVERALVRNQLLVTSRELVERTREATSQMRRRTLEQRDHIAERQRRWAELIGGDARIERLWPCMSPPVRLPVRARLPRGQAAAILLCGACDEVLATGTYAADLTVTLRCFSCLMYNTGSRQPLDG